MKYVYMSNLRGHIYNNTIVHQIVHTNMYAECKQVVLTGKCTGLAHCIPYQCGCNISHWKCLLEPRYLDREQEPLPEYHPHLCGFPT